MKHDEVLVHVRDLVAKGQTTEMIAAELGITEVEASKARADIVAKEHERLVTRKPEEAYVEYVLHTSARVRKATQLCELAEQCGDYRAAFGALKAAQDFHDKILKHGIALGFVARTKAGAVTTGQMSYPQLQEHLANELKRVVEMTQGYGDVSFTELPVSTAPRTDVPDDEPDFEDAEIVEDSGSDDNDQEQLTRANARGSMTERQGRRGATRRAV